MGNEPDSLYALNEIQKVAALMRFELERGKIDEFANLLNYHWELSRKVDAGSTNTLIDQIFLSIEDLIDAKMVWWRRWRWFPSGDPEKKVSRKQMYINA